MKIQDASRSRSGAGLHLTGKYIGAALGLQVRERKTRPPILLLEKNRALIKTPAEAVTATMEEEPEKIEPIPPTAINSSPLHAALASTLIFRVWNWIRHRQVFRTSSKRLRVAETVSLGEKRFVAVIQVDGGQYLVGGGASNVSLLAQLNGKDSFATLLQASLPAAEQSRDQR
jgi:flagellar biogenesis protein FliO